MADAPSQRGRLAIVTGANSGIGLETARALAGLGARVVMACRNLESAQAAADEIRGTCPDAALDIVGLDLSSQQSVRAAASEIREKFGRIDLLIANAGVLAPTAGVTEDGFEIDFGTNFLGHFTLIGNVIDLMAPGGRIVTVGSVAHRRGVIDFDDFAPRADFPMSRAYPRSKLAQMIFAVELQRRLQAHGRDVASLIAHPGAARTGVMRGHNRFLQWGFHSPKTRPLVRLFIQEPPDGALPTIRAATDPEACGGQYYGPSGRMQLTGDPVIVHAKPIVVDATTGARLWETAEQMTGVEYL